jgi:hypothetical protein
MDSAETIILPIASLVEVSCIDAGHTTVVRLRAPDDREVVLLLPTRTARELVMSIGRSENPHHPPPNSA